MKVEFYKHNIEQMDIDNVVSVLHSTFLTTGDKVAEFEKKFAEYIGCKYVVGLTSCTGALHLSLLALGISHGDEVITTPMTFVATANSIIEAGAKPIFVDVESDTGNINADLIESVITPRTKAIMPVHLYGQLCEMDKIQYVANKYGLFVIEDAAHAIEASRNGIRVGEIGDATCFSHYVTKTLQCGEGGSVAMNNQETANNIRKMRHHGISTNASERYTKKYEHWDMDIFGWKYNMDNIKAALLINQINRLDEYLKRREEICQKYEKAFADTSIKFLTVLPKSKSARLMFTILVDDRDNVMHKLQEKGIGVAVNYRAIHLLTYYSETYGYKRGDYPIAEGIGDRTITLPLYPKLTNEEVEYVIQSVKEVVC
jgi:dTDP-4-amino-4,6-dideoxygalactose transaminase